MCNTLKAWEERINKEEMPIFNTSITSISNITSASDTSASDLATIILHDPALSAKILKFANSSFYKTTTDTSISTISRAIVRMGFEQIRELTLSMAIIDSLIAGGKRKHLAHLLSRAVHSAVQARELAEKMGESQIEEIFIATLLYDLGEMAFWSLADQEEIDNLQKTLQHQNNTPEKAQKKAIGFCFRDLTAILIERWNLKGILEKISKKRKGKNLPTKIINSCRELAKNSEHGWETEEVQIVARRIANYMNISLSSANNIIKKNSKLAAEVAAVYNPEIAKHIPGHEKILQKTEIAGKEEIIVKFPEPDPMLLLKILREISSMLQSSPDFNLVLGGLLEGIYRGVGMDRALFALYTPKSRIKAKFVLGTTVEYLRDNFVFPVEMDKSNPFFDALFERRKGIWIKNTSFCEYSSPVIYQMKSLLDVNSFFMAPVIAGNNPVGIFYADRQPSKRPLDINSFENFEHLGQQACISIEYISKKENK